MKRARLDILLQDNNGRRPQSWLWMPQGLEAPAVLAFANALRGPLLALTSARLSEMIYRVPILGPDAAPPRAGADSKRSATLLYSSGGISARFILPSPVAGLVETTGIFAGYRITRDSAAAAGLLDELETIVAGTVLADGTPWPATFDIGAIDERP